MIKKRSKRSFHRWFALIDEEGCRLLRCELTPQGTPHVEEVDAFENPWPRPDRGRPLALGGMTGHSYAAPHHSVGEQLHHFAKEVVEWLNKKREKYTVDRLVIFGTPRLIGELRQASWGEPASGVALRDGNLMRLHTDELAVHPKVADLILSNKNE